MQTKLTVRVEARLIRRAKSFAQKRGTSLSQLIADFFSSLEAEPEPAKLPPKTSALYGLLEGKSVIEDNYKQYLEKKHK